MMTSRITRAARLAPLAVSALVAAGCSGLLDVKNPNNVNQNDLSNPAAAAAIANGSLAAVSKGVSNILGPMSAVSDEFAQAGSRDAWLQLTYGNIDDAHNEFSDAAWPDVAQGRWTADDAIQRLQAFADAKTLPNIADLTRSYIYGAIIYGTIADAYNDAVVGSDHSTATPPVGPANMVKLYDTGIGYLGKALALAQANNDAASKVAATALRARLEFAKAMWTMLHPAGQKPVSPLVADAAATADAQAFFALNPPRDWAYQFSYSANTVSNVSANNSNEQLYIRISDVYMVPDASGKHYASTRLQDPIDKIPSPTLTANIKSWVSNRAYSPITVVSAREMYLILAEAALKSGDNTAFAANINAVRSMDGLIPWSGQVDALQILEHERQVNLFLEMRRLADMYRFGLASPSWQATSAAATKPGSFFPIAYSEQLTNCYLAGTCASK
ncbi:MAG TPA: RagB/SusD family nutrient uptake outer membrane protein [Longimicrobiales bacterium]